MLLQNISYLRYRRYDPTSEHKWSQEHWDARAIVEAIKNEPYKGYAAVSIGNKWRTIDYANRAVAIEWFIDRVKKQTNFLDPGGYAICPIPDRSCTVKNGRPSKVMELAIPLAQAFPNLAIWDGLRFTREMPSSRATGMRDENVIFGALTMIGTPPDKYILILDDVCTTGSHARAAARILKKAGVTNKIRAISVARTMSQPNEKVFGFRSDVIETP
jgi:hypothetical protein